MRYVIIFIIGFTLPLPLMMALILLIRAQTLAGGLMGLAFTIVLSAAPVILLKWKSCKSRKQRWLMAGSPASVFVMLLAWTYLITPDGTTSPDSPIRQVYLDGDGLYRRASLANLVPEIDQLNLGITLFPYIDPSLGGAQQKRIRQLFLDVYQKMESEPDFHALGSNMNYAYREPIFMNFDVGHAYVYVPRPPDSKSIRKLPVILFLHGSLGNFKGYSWVLKELAERHPCAVVAPSFGLGNWNRSGGTEAIERVRRWIGTQPQMDSQRVYLAALSNGGGGLMRAAIENPGAYRGLISISGYLKEELVRSDEFINGWTGRPVLILQGARDDRILPGEVDKAASLMGLNGIHVSRRTWSDEDHFLFFSKQGELLREIDTWMRQNP